MRNSIIFLLIVQLFRTSWCQCKFTVKEVEEETRIVAVSRKGQFEVLNEDKIDPGEIVHFICTDVDVVQVTCGHNNQFSHTLPIQNCTNPLKAVVEQTFDGSCRFQTYRVGYKVGSGFLELYSSCFNKQQLASLLTSHDAHPNSLATKRPDSAFTTDGVLTLKDAATYQAKAVFARFEALLGSQQPYVRSQTDVIIDRGHLAPSADYLFPVNMRATFKYINAIPQFSTINRGNWKSIEDFVRKYVDISGNARIVTGAFDVLRLPDRNGNLVEMYLEDGNRNPIPKWLYKIVNNPSGTIVFLTHNNVFDSRPPSPMCKIVVCPVQLKNTPESGFTYCCDPNDFERNIFPHVYSQN